MARHLAGADFEGVEVFASELEVEVSESAVGVEAYESEAGVEVYESGLGVEVFDSEGIGPLIRRVATVHR